MVGNHTSRTHTNTIRIIPQPSIFRCFVSPLPFPVVPPPFYPTIISESRAINLHDPPPSPRSNVEEKEKKLLSLLCLLEDNDPTSFFSSLSPPFAICTNILRSAPQKRGLLGHRHQVFFLPGLPLSHAQPQEWGTALRPPPLPLLTAAASFSRMGARGEAQTCCLMGSAQK